MPIDEVGPTSRPTYRLASDYCLDLQAQVTAKILTAHLDGKIDFEELATMTVNMAATLIRVAYGQDDVDPVWAEEFAEQFKEYMLERLLSLPPLPAEGPCHRPPAAPPAAAAAMPNTRAVPIEAIVSCLENAGYCNMAATVRALAHEPQEPSTITVTASGGSTASLCR